jgi:hypothetical protein
MKKNKINKHIFKGLCAASDLDVGSSSQPLRPSLQHLHCVAGKQPQRALSYVILDDLRASIVSDRQHLCLHARVRIAAASLTGAGRFMITLPASRKSELLLTPEQYTDNVHLRFGLGLTRRIHDEGCSCNCGKKPADFVFVQEFFDHVMSCHKTRGMKLKRHNLILPILSTFFTEQGYEWDTSSDGCGFSNVIQSIPGQGSGRLPGDKKLDAVAHWLPDKSKSLGIDVTIYHACAPSATCEQAAALPDSPSYITRQAEASKFAKYSEPCSERGISHLPIAFNSYGGWGDEVMRRVIKPFFDELRRHEYEQTGQEWVALQKREFLFQRVSVAVARGNTMILNTMRQGWHSHKRSKETRGVMPRAVLNTSERSHVAQTILSSC